MSSLPPSHYFPPAESADANGLVGFGGELACEWLLDAYRHGIFPWPMWGDEEPLAWWSLDPRAIFEMGEMYVARRLRRTIRSGKFEATCDQAFSGVMRGCATGRGRRGGTWITPSMLSAYTHLFDLGYAHSVEVWHDGKLAGGVYGVAIGGLFAAESMFFRVRDASKVAFVHLMAHLVARGYRLFDIQQMTDNSARLGALEISRREYLLRLAEAIELPVTFGDNLQGDVPSLIELNSARKRLDKSHSAR
jgi:leucyl/phenylalanyl-tRNA--protein transferase